ncbi:uncharacterized protein LOC131149185 [Malania oleifera]|uniref:uncharacterized protein LOC131149185 n=1 Tax=Malania oleifera TaxID=397392 RepID=UPI0025AE95EC|nr:uncharacterized protein LOC131149185 [Malania oleifera]
MASQPAAPPQNPRTPATNRDHTHGHRSPSPYPYTAAASLNSGHSHCLRPQKISREPLLQTASRALAATPSQTRLNQRQRASPLQSSTQATAQLRPPDSPTATFIWSILADH